MGSTVIDNLADALGRTHVGDEELSYKGQGLKLDTAESAEELVRGIEQHQDFRALCLEGNTIGVEAAKVIAKALESKSQLQRCHWSDMFTGRLRSEIPPALRCLGGALMTAGVRLTELDLSDNAFGPDGVRGIEALLKSPACHSLRELRLSNCGMGIGGGKILAAALTECQEQSSALGVPLRLKVFVAGRNRLENEGAIALAKAFKLIGSLEEVHMPQNGINHVGITALATAVQHNPDLRVLNFNDNTFTSRGATAMAQALRHLRNVQVINFGDCLVRSEGALVISAVLREALPILKELNLSFGEITEAAALVVAQATKGKPHMEKLDLNGNCLGLQGCEALQKAMEDMEMGDVLASLSDDEGEDNEEEEEDEDDEDGEEEEDVEETKENSLTLDQNSPEEIRSLLSSPSAQNFLEQAAENSGLQQQLAALEPDQAAGVLLKIFSMYSEEPEAKSAVLEAGDAVWKKLFSESLLNSSCVLSSLLVMIGLLKGERKVAKVPLVPGQLLCLEHAVQQDYFPQDLAAVLHTFLSKKDDALQSCGQVKQRLLVTLEKKCDAEH